MSPAAGMRWARQSSKRSCPRTAAHRDGATHDVGRAHTEGL
jgi:hypothetical protein